MEVGAELTSPRGVYSVAREDWRGPNRPRIARIRKSLIWVSIRYIGGGRIVSLRGVVDGLSSPMYGHAMR